MSAQASDLFRKTARRWVGQIGSGGVADAVVTTIPLSSVTNLPTDTGVTVTIDRVDANGVATSSKEETVTGVVSGTNLISCTRGVEGTAQSHAAGAVVEVLFSNKIWNDFIDGVMVEHQQDGTHGTLDAPVFDSPVVTTGIFDANSNELMKVTATGSAVNELTLANAATGSGPILSATGTNDNIDININPKGTGRIKSGTVAVPTISSTDSFTNKTIVARAATYAPVGAGTTTIDLSTGGRHTVTMPAATQTLAISNATTGQCFVVEINNVTSQGALTWFSTIKWAGGSAPTLTGTNGKRDTFGFIVTGTGTYDGFIVGQNI